VYITAPNQAVVGAPFQTEADGSGVSEQVTFTSPSDIAAGIYAITFEGVSSKAKAIAYFEITAAAAQPAPPPGGVHASVNAAVDPERGPRGTVFTAIARGFQGGERIGVYVTAPNQAVIGAPFQVSADGSGVSEPVTFRSSSDLPTGIYAITFEGVSSKARSIAYFEVTP
jgi:predicted transcriptional regulator